MKNKPRCKHCRKIIRSGEKIQRLPLNAQVHVACLTDYIADALKKVYAKKKKNKADMRKAKVESQKSKSKKTATTSFNRFIRKRDAEKGCITCGRTVFFGDRAYHAGHYKHVGSRVDLEHNEDNCFGQCLTEESNLVLTKGKGVSVSIKRVKVGDKIQAFDEKTFEKSVAIVISNTSFLPRRLFKIELENGKMFYATVDHKVVVDNKWVEIQDIKVGADIMQFDN